MRTNLFIISLMVTVGCHAQTDEFQQAYDSFKKQAQTKYDNFRDKANQQYAEFVKETWKQYKTLPAIPKPKEQEKPPVVIKDKEQKKPIKDNALPIQGTVAPPVPKPQPVPVAPIKEQAVPQESWQTLSLYGTTMKVRFNEGEQLMLNACDELSVAAAWQQLSGTAFNNTIRDCLTIRMERNLSDWAYLQLLAAVAESALGKGNAATLLMAYLYCQSGYQMRLASTNGRLYMLYASRHHIYGQDYFLLDGVNYYPYQCDEEQMHICAVGFPQEKPLSLLMTQQQNLNVVKSESRTLKSERYPDIVATLSVNRNLVDFYNTYPSSCIDNNFMTRWVMYANAPMDETAKNSLYPALKQCINGLGQKEAMERLLNWVQTAFVYEYDDKVWGHDRAFFPEETLYYPYADCEDRSILLSRLVRDLLGLKCILIYYPGHLAMAVNFTDDVKGDYILLNNQRYVVCDPTYIGAPVGLTMPEMDNSKATVILLE